MEDFKIMFADNPINHDCVECKTNYPILFKDLLIDGNEIPCPNCGAIFKVVHEPGFQQDMENFEKSFMRVLNFFK